MLEPLDDTTLTAEVLRVNERYLREIVEAYNVCPFARRARETGELVRRVLLQRNTDVAAMLQLLDELEAGASTVSVCIAIFPRLALDPRAFDRFAQDVREADQARRGGGRPPFVSASFHPDYARDDRTPARLVPFFRRSPDPSIQLVRLAILDEVRGQPRGKFHFDGSPAAWKALEARMAGVDVTARITEDNHQLTTTVGLDTLEARYADIHADRDRSYARRLDAP